MPSRAVIVLSPALIVPLPLNRFPNKLAPKVLNSIRRNSPPCSLTLLLAASLTPFIHEPDYSSELFS